MIMGFLYWLYSILHLSFNIWAIFKLLITKVYEWFTDIYIQCDFFMQLMFGAARGFILLTIKGRLKPQVLGILCADSPLMMAFTKKVSCFVPLFVVFVWVKILLKGSLILKMNVHYAPITALEVNTSPRLEILNPIVALMALPNSASTGHITELNYIRIILSGVLVTRVWESNMVKLVPVWWDYASVI